MRDLDHQNNNKQWWTDHTMSYDWKDVIGSEKYSLEWFREADRRFLFAARLFTGNENPFEELIGLDNLQGKRVLEIGCGMGFHTELMLRAGAILTSIDISPTSVDATRKRLHAAGLHGDVREMDALNIDQIDENFDLIWSWGVLHHSSHTARAIKMCAKKLTRDGSFKLMVYHTGGVSAYYTIVRRYITGFWQGSELDNLLWNDADGFTARHYTNDGFCDLLLGYFDQVDSKIFGQDADVVPLPRKLRPFFLNRISKDSQIRLARSRGSMIFATCSSPLP